VEVATILVEGNKLHLTGSTLIYVPIACLLDFLELLQKQQFAIDWAVEMHLTGDKVKWLQELHTGHGFGVSDGSY